MRVTRWVTQVKTRSDTHEVRVRVRVTRRVTHVRTRSNAREVEGEGKGVGEGEVDPELVRPSRPPPLRRGGSSSSSSSSPPPLLLSVLSSPPPSRGTPAPMLATCWIKKGDVFEARSRTRTMGLQCSLAAPTFSGFLNS